MPNRHANLRLRKSAMALTGAAALTALLTACNGNINGTLSDTSPTPATTSATPAPGDSATTGTTTGGTTGGSSGTNAAAGGSAPACQASQLGYSWAGTKAAPSGGSDQMQATVALTNNSGHACSMYGFPGVDLVNSGEQWSLQRAGTTPHTVTVAGGASAHFTITYLVWHSGDSAAFRPTTVVITAPNQRTSYDLPWRFGPVLKQDGATHPGTFIDPVRK
ncbi:DUF4232 domain-containing protein [Streptomyces sp. NBC_01537]|uniref:DUF4232 domain-containing protein n=1 Tax=Streptomyces sp. NBC_01537 TaxID=2903896 RepID=UPI00386823FD